MDAQEVHFGGSFDFAFEANIENYSRDESNDDIFFDILNAKK